MSRTILIECSPRRPSDGVVVPVRLVFKSIERANFFNAQWHPVVVSVPAFESSLGFDGRSFGAAPSPQIGDLVFALTEATRFAASLVWTNAQIVMRHALWPASGRDPADADFEEMWTGQAEDIATGSGQARVRLLDNGQALRVPAAAAKFGSTGDALLDSADALRDRSAETRVPRAWGRLLSIPALLVDRPNNIWLFAGNAATSVQAFYDGGAAFTLGVARASLAALQANAPAAGTVDYCLDAGGKFLARPWTAPTYPFTAAATFGSTTAANIASAIVTGRTAVTFAAGTVAAFNTAQGADCGIYLDDDTTVASALDRLFSGLGAWWRLSSAGTITLGRWAWGTPALTVASHRRHAPERLRVLAPTRRRSLGYARNDRVHSESEIARILLADDLTYTDGTSIEALKPATAGATRNVITTSASAPLSPINGDLWVDTSGTYVVFKLRSSSAWVTGANALTAYNALSDKPVALADINTTESAKLAGIAAGATKNTDGGNYIHDPRGYDWTVGGGATVEHLNLTGPIIESDRARLPPSVPGSIVFFSPIDSDGIRRYPVTHGERFYAAIWAYRTEGASSADMRLNLYDAQTNYLDAVLIPGTGINFFTCPDGAWYYFRGQYDIPANVGYVLPHAGFNDGASSSPLFVAMPYWGKQQPGADVTATSLPRLTMPASPTIFGDVAGAPLADQLPRQLSATRTLGTANVSATTTWSIATVPASPVITATISSAGLIEITACGASGKIVVTSVRDGVTLIDEFSVTKINSVPSVTGGGAGSPTTAFDTTIASVSSTSYGGAQAGMLTVVAGPAGTVACTAPLSFSGSGAAAGKWQWRIVGGSYADIVAEITSTSSAVTGEPDTGYIEVNQTKTGLTDGSTYEFQLLLRRTGGSGTLSFNGTATAAGS